MIEFTGYISGNAEKRFQKRTRNVGQNALLAGLVVVLPAIIIMAIKIRDWRLPVMYCSMFVIVPLLVRIPKSKKEKIAYLPKRIFTDEDHIICIADKYIDDKPICEVTEVRDYGEFYELVFSFGYLSEKFICQKDFLTKGTIKEFAEVLKIPKSTIGRYVRGT